MADSNSRQQEPAGDGYHMEDHEIVPDTAERAESAAAGIALGIADFTDPLGVTTGMIHGSAPDAQAESTEDSDDTPSFPNP